MADAASISNGYGGYGRSTDVVTEAMERARAAASRRAKLEQALPATGAAAGSKIGSQDGSVVGSVRGTDRVEVSAMALYVSKLQQLPAVRADLVARVRSEINAGVYDTDERMNAAMDEMMKDVGL